MFPLISGLLGVASTGLSIFGGMEKAAGEKKQSEALKKEEASRHKQMLLDVQRSRLEAVRNAMVTSSLATAAAANQGALQSSSYRTGKSSITNEKNYQLEGLQQNLAIGEEIFQAHNDYYKAGGQVAFGQSVTNLGGAIAGNIDNLSRLGNFAFGGQSQSTGVPTYSDNKAVTIGAIP